MVSERVAYRNKFVTVFNDEVKFLSGEMGRYLRIQSSGGLSGVVIIAIDRGNIGLVRTFRYPIGEFQWALPRGFAESPDVLETAQIELLEELGATASSMRLLGQLTPDSGLLSNRVSVVIANVDSISDRYDTEEVSEIQWLPAERIFRMVDAGEIEDGFTLAALFLCLRKVIL